ncbi:MAG: hypothetical protein ABIU63_09400 [Chitinophagaceae bacterium]
MHLLYITFGKDIANHIQAAFSIYSFLTQNNTPDSINIITDEPVFYRHLASVVNIIEVDEAQLQEWRGPHNFLWRIKIKAIAKICAAYPGEPVMYLDTDTVLYRNAADIRNRLDKGHALMHENEGPLSAASSKTEKKMWADVKNNLYGNIKISAQDAMWNAGIVATPNTSNSAEIQLALQICDDMCAAGVPRRLIEQFALSVALQHTYGLFPASKSIAHYWSNKEAWNVAIAKFFMQSYLQQFSLSQIIESLKEMDFSAIPVVMKQTNTNKRLQKKIDYFFPPRDTAFVSNQLKEASPGKHI